MAAAAALLAGCASNKIDWGSRVGNYTFDDVVLEMGPPDKVATLQDGTKVAEWLTSKGRRMGGSFFISRGRFIHSTPDFEGPDYYMRLIFDQDGRLTSYKQVVK